MQPQCQISPTISLTNYVLSINNTRVTMDVGEIVHHVVTMRNFRKLWDVGQFTTTKVFDAVDWMAVASTMHYFPKKI